MNPNSNLAFVHLGSVAAQASGLSQLLLRALCAPPSAFCVTSFCLFSLKTENTENLQLSTSSESPEAFSSPCPLCSALCGLSVDVFSPFFT